MKWGTFFCLALLLLYLRLYLLSRLELSGVRPDLFIIMLVYLAAHADTMSAFIANWFLGMLQDIFSGGPGVFFTLFFCLMSLVVSRFQAGFFQENYWTRLVFVFLCAFQCNFLYGLWITYLYPECYLQALSLKVLLGTLYTTALAPICFYGFGWLALIAPPKV